MATTLLVLTLAKNHDSKGVIQQVLDTFAAVRAVYARDREHALKLLQYSKFALVIVEVIPPELNELEVIREAKRGPTLKPTPVIAVTSLRTAQLEALSEGADECLVQPLDKDTIRDVVDKYLG